MTGGLSFGGLSGLSFGAAYVFVRSGGAWSQQQKLLAADVRPGDEFGDSVALSEETLVVGARRTNVAPGFGQGAAYVFVGSGGAWSQQ
jgi:hypothetical protein